MIDNALDRKLCRQRASELSQNDGKSFFVIDQEVILDGLVKRRACRRNTQNETLCASFYQVPCNYEQCPNTMSSTGKSQPFSGVVAIIAAYLVKTDSRRHLRAMWIGVGAAAIASIGSGFVFDALIGDLEGRSEQAIEGTIAFLAVAVLTWMIFWMRRNSRNISRDLHAKIDAALDRSPLGIEWGLVSDTVWNVTSGPFAEGSTMHDFVKGLSAGVRTRRESVLLDTWPTSIPLRGSSIEIPVRNAHRQTAANAPLPKSADPGWTARTVRSGSVARFTVGPPQSSGRTRSAVVGHRQRRLTRFLDSEQIDGDSNLSDDTTQMGTFVSCADVQAE